MGDAFDRVEKATRLEGPHGWIQWKGTNVCMDVYCACGAHVHVDAEFCYQVECPHCKRVYAVGAYVRLVELTEEEQREGEPRVVVAQEDYERS
jgi:hypothetical protein